MTNSYLTVTNRLYRQWMFLILLSCTWRKIIFSSRKQPDDQQIKAYAKLSCDVSNLTTNACSETRWRKLRRMKNSSTWCKRVNFEEGDDGQRHAEFTHIHTTILVQSLSAVAPASSDMCEWVWHYCYGRQRVVLFFFLPWVIIDWCQVRWPHSRQGQATASWTQHPVVSGDN